MVPCNPYTRKENPAMEKIMTIAGKLWKVEEIIYFRMTPYFGDSSKIIKIPVNYYPYNYRYVFAHTKKEAIQIWNAEIDHDFGRALRYTNYDKILSVLKKRFKFTGKVSYAGKTTLASSQINAQPVDLLSLPTDPKEIFPYMSERTKDKFLAISYIAKYYYGKIENAMYYADTEKSLNKRVIINTASMITSSIEELEDTIESFNVFEIKGTVTLMEKRIFSKKYKEIKKPLHLGRNHYIIATDKDSAWCKFCTGYIFESSEELMQLTLKELKHKKGIWSRLITRYIPRDNCSFDLYEQTIEDLSRMSDHDLADSILSRYVAYFSKMPMQLFQNTKERPKLVEDVVNSKSPIGWIPDAINKAMVESLHMDVYDDLRK